MSFVFYILAALTVAGGLAAMLLKNTVHCALALTVAFAGQALLFLDGLRGGEFGRLQNGRTDHHHRFVAVF